MFYSHTYLRRNGRFGLIWLAATQSKVLNKRELYAINLAMTCSDILNHIPGYASKEVGKHPRRFSLYLSSQLMYGSVKILQKQWEYLFLDLSALLRKCHPEVTSDIDLIMVKQDPVTIASCVPSTKDYNPFFGVFKESTVDVEAYLDIWDSNYVSEHLLRQSEQPDIGSPASSVADRMSIQIRDSHVTPIDLMLPGEQDLPDLDTDNLALLSDDVNLSAEELLSPQVSRILAATEVTQTRVSQYGRLSLEETPAVRTSDEIPRTPQKPKRKRRHDVPDERRVKHKVIEQGDLAGAAGVAGEEQEFDMAGMTTPSIHTRPGIGVMPPHGHDWLQQQPSIQLSPVTPSPSPARRRKSYKLIIDQTIQMTRDEIRNNMLTSESTTQPLVLPSVHQVDLFKEPGTKSLKNPVLAKLWARNCKFGLRVYDTESESTPSTQTVTSPLPLKSLSLSVEQRRDISAASASLEGDQSRSLLAQSSDESQAGISAMKQRASLEGEPSGREGLSLTELEQTGDLGTLPPWPEEQEHMISPIPRIPLSDQRAAPQPSDEEPYPAERQTLEGGDTPRTQVLKLVRRNVRTAEDWTTFRIICPPSSNDRLQAARLFMGLCCQVGLGNLCVRQDEPYSDIFIWLPAERPE